eukprot:2706793-Prymnesium_polylepis.1
MGIWLASRRPYRGMCVRQQRSSCRSSRWRSWAGGAHATVGSSGERDARAGGRKDVRGRVMRHTRTEATWMRRAAEPRGGSGRETRGSCRGTARTAHATAASRPRRSRTTLALPQTAPSAACNREAF